MATLKSLVDETTNIKNELVECYTNLKNNLIEKGVECEDSDKMASLISKVKGVSLVSKASDNILFSWENEKRIDSTKTGYDTLYPVYSIPCCFKGACRLDFKFKGNSSGSYYYAIVKLIRSGEEIYVSESFKTNSTNLNVVLDIDNIMPLDTIEILTMIRSSDGYSRFKEFYLKGDLH